MVPLPILLTHLAVIEPHHYPDISILSFVIMIHSFFLSSDRCVGVFPSCAPITLGRISKQILQSRLVLPTVVCIESFALLLLFRTPLTCVIFVVFSLQMVIGSSPLISKQFWVRRLWNRGQAINVRAYAGRLFLE